MFHAFRLYVVALVAEISALLATGKSLSEVAVVLLAVFTPVFPVMVGYFLTRKRLNRQDAKVQEVHVLVNNRLSKTLDDLQRALLANIELKERLGEPVRPSERAAANAAGSDTPPIEIKKLTE